MGEVFRQFVKYMFQKNMLIQGKLEVGGERVDLKKIACPILNLTAQHDHLVPPNQSLPFNDAVSSTDRKSINFPVGHIGLAVSSKSHRDGAGGQLAGRARRSPAALRGTDMSSGPNAKQHKNPLEETLPTQLDLRTRVAMITGGAGGIGRATCLELARKGIRAVGVVDLSPGVDDFCLDGNKRIGREVLIPYCGDVTEPGFRRSAFADLERRFGTVTVCIRRRASRVIGSLCRSTRDRRA